MPERDESWLAGPGTMFLSAAIFGYFGFMMGFPEVDPKTGNLIPLVVTLKWTLRGSAIAFLLSALLTMGRSLPGNMLFAISGLVSSILLLVVVGWDWTSPWHSGIHPFLLLIFAAWNGWGSWMALKMILASRMPAPELFEPPG